MKRLLSIAALLLLCAAPAGATSSFPGVIKDSLGLGSAPACMVCHTTASGGSGTATQPFAASLLAAGLVPFDDASLQGALSQLETDGTDSDGDGTGDIDELKAGSDPNRAGGADGGPTPDPVQYGFGCAQAPRGGALALLLFGLGLRRWRRAPCPRR